MPRVIRRRLSNVLIGLSLLLCAAAAARASGWNDFEQPIGDGYAIFRANAGDVSLTRNGIVVARDGTLVAFAVTSSSVFTRHRDASGTDVYYVVRKSPERVIGPLTPGAFAVNPAVVEAGSLAWQAPANPNLAASDKGQVAFSWVAISATVLLGIGFMAVTAVVVWSVRYRRRAST